MTEPLPLDRGGPEQTLTLTVRLRWALAGVALLVVPATAMMVSYLAEIYAESQAQVRQLALATEIDGLWRSLEQGIDLGGGEPRRIEQSVGVFVDGVSALHERYPRARDALSEAARQAVGLQDRAMKLVEVGAQKRARDAERTQTVFGRALGAMDEVGDQAALLSLQASVRNQVMALAQAVAAVRSAALASSTNAAKALEGRVDAGNRNLVTLAMLILVYLGYLFLFLPSRLLSSFARIRASLRQAQSGDLTVRAPVEGSDDVAVLAREFNTMMDVVEKFDVRKKNRIYQDSQVVRLLGDAVDFPFALVGLDAHVEVANAQFWALVDRPAPTRGQRLHLTDVVGGGAGELADLISASVERRRTVVDHPVDLVSEKGRTRHLQLTMEPIRGVDARLTHFLMILSEIPALDHSSTDFPQAKGSVASSAK